MGKRLAAEFPSARALYDRAAEILGYDLATLCFEGPAEELDSTVISQPAIFVTSLAALEKLRAEQPDVVLACEMAAGLSLGEYTALVFAGAMTFEDGLRVVQRRGEAMQQAADATPSGMISALLLEREKVEAICREAGEVGRLELANFLCPGNVVLSGENAACERAAELIDKAGGKAVPLAVAGAFHTSIMKPADVRLAEALAGDPDRLERRCVRPRGAGRAPRASRAAGRQPGPVGGLDPVHAGPGGGRVLRDRPGEGPAGFDEADRPQGRLHDHQRFVGVIRGGTARPKVQSRPNGPRGPLIPCRNDERWTLIVSIPVCYNGLWDFAGCGRFSPPRPRIAVYRIWKRRYIFCTRRTRPGGQRPVSAIGRATEITSLQASVLAVCCRR
jgi:hypothetical protein